MATIATAKKGSLGVIRSATTTDQAYIRTFRQMYFGSADAPLRISISRPSVCGGRFMQVRDRLKARY
jgi:hypothetical protein